MYRQEILKFDTSPGVINLIPKFVLNKNFLYGMTRAISPTGKNISTLIIKGLNFFSFQLGTVANPVAH